jgi:hypothetical protein
MLVGMATATLPAPSRVSKRSLTLAEAGDQWITCRQEMDRLKPLLEESAAVLLDHFAKTKKRTYRDRIILVIGAPKLVLDQGKVRCFLAERLGEFQKKTAPTRSLTLLK